MLEQQPAAAARGSISERLEEGDRVPDGEHQLVAAGLLVASRLRGEPIGELLGVDDVRTAHALLEPPVAVTENVGSRVPDAAPWSEVAHGPGRHGVQLECLDVVRVTACPQVADVEALRQELPGTELPGRRLVPANDDDTSLSLGHDRGAYSPRRAAIARR